MLHSSSRALSSLSLTNTSLQAPTKAMTQLIGRRIQDIQIITRNRGDGTISSGQSLSAEHQYLTSGIKTLQQTIFLTDGTRLTTVATFFVENPFTTQSIALNISGTSLSSPQYQPLNFGLHLFPKTLTTAINITNTFGDNHHEYFSVLPLSTIKLQTPFNDIGNQTLTSLGTINRCVSVSNQGTVHITPTDLCLTALKSGTLKDFTCDMDKDGIPDICDDDIDGDGMKNEL
ncbi:MAG: hypothetical protein LBG59_06790 [Candidatus Peribacteria bacterium]|nr:hypothetical protein [Candidatus Peribacteria bacterium]